jgi:hypothetical protein
VLSVALSLRATDASFVAAVYDRRNCRRNAPPPCGNHH